MSSEENKTENPSTPDDLESLLVEFEDGVANRSSEDVLPWLAARSEIEKQIDDLTSGQAERLQKADEKLIENAGDVLDEVGLDKLQAERQASSRGADEWWWHLDTLAAVPVKKPTQRQVLLSRLFTAVEIGVLIVAVFLLLQRLNIIQPPPAPTATRFPTNTPAPTATIDAAAFDMSGATKFVSDDKVVEISLPKGWTGAPGTSSQTYQFSYAKGQANEIGMQVLIDKTDGLYSRVLNLTQSFPNPKAAFDAFKASQGAQGLTFGDVQDAKVGDATGSRVLISLPADPQSGAGESVVDLWVVSLSDGKSAMLLLRSSKDQWENPAKPILEKMIGTLKITLANIPTLTPTSTLHPLELTQTAIMVPVQASQTAIQGTINALTPTATATLTPSITPTPSLTVTPGGPSVTPFPTSTNTNTPAPATATNTAAPATATTAATSTTVPTTAAPSNTPVPPTNTSVPASNTPVPPTNTSVPASNTPVPATTVAPTSVPATATSTSTMTETPKP